MKPVFLAGLAATALLILAACDSGGSDTPASSQAPAANTTSANTTPGNTTPGNTTPGNTTPGNTTPGNTTPGNTTLGISGASADLGTGPEGLIGGKLASILGGDDRQSAAVAATQAATLPIGQKVTWQGSSNATDIPATGWASPVGAPYRDSAGRTCRFVQQSATHGSDSANDTLKICNGSGGWVPA